MSQTSSEKFLYFTVGLLKGSAALEALRQDATKYHMIDHPGQLIALRLTEYYEMMDQGILRPAVPAPAPVVKSHEEAETVAEHEQPSATDKHVAQQSVAASFTSSVPSLTNGQPQSTPVPVHIHNPSAGHGEATTATNQLTGKMRALRRNGENVVSVSSAAEQNADEAADYWSTL